VDVGSACVDIYVNPKDGRTCLFVRLRISPPRIKLAASNFARRFIGVQSRENTFLGTLLPRSPKSDESPASPAPPMAAQRTCALSSHGAGDAGHAYRIGMWIYGRPRRRTYLLRYRAEKQTDKRCKKIKPARLQSTHG